MKFRLPPNCGAISHAGAAVTIAADASVDLDSTAIALLEPHEIIPFGDPAPLDRNAIDRMARNDLVVALQARDVPLPRDATEKLMRSLLRQALAKPTQ